MNLLTTYYRRRAIDSFMHLKKQVHLYVLTISNFLYYIMFVVSFMFLEYLNNKDTNVLILVH